MKKTAVITGASGGIGGAAAIQLAKEGYSLALLGNRSKEKLQKVKQAISFGVTLTATARLTFRTQ